MPWKQALSDTETQKAILKLILQAIPAVGVVINHILIRRNARRCKNAIIKGTHVHSHTTPKAHR